ncbi:Beta-lactamase superfamily domain protein [compost metagenome]
MAFAGTSEHTAEDLPDIDVLLITHDHWDHLDYPSAIPLRSKVGQPRAGSSNYRPWLVDYNEYRPHESLGGLPPAQFMPRLTLAPIVYQPMST